MNLIIYISVLISVIISIVSAIFTYLNIKLANSATIHAMLETHDVEQHLFEKCPGNKFGPEMFGPPISNSPSSYLNLIIINDGPGVAKNIEWKIEKIRNNGTSIARDSNSLPYIGNGSKVNVKGYIEVQRLLDKKNEFSYNVTVTFQPFMYGRKKIISEQFNAFGELQNFTLS